MTLYELIKQYSNGSEKTVWSSIKIISDYIDDKLTSRQKKCLNRCLYGIMSDGHYNEELAKEDIDNMTMSDGSTSKFIGLDMATVWFNQQTKATPYNVYDFWVTCNMLLTDNYGLLKKWFPEATDDQIMDKIREMAINWLNDDDNPFGTSKIWSYFNSKNNESDIEKSRS